MSTTRSIVVAIAVALSGLVGCASGGEREAAATTTRRSPTTTTTAAVRHVDVSVYFLTGENLAPGAARTVEAPAVVAGALTAVLKGPTEAEKKIGRVTVIPAGTRLLGVTMENRTASVDLSEEFASGGGSLPMQARVAQVVYTATQFPGVEAVRFRIDGEPVSALGGEGVLLEEPVRRADFEFQGRFDTLAPRSSSRDHCRSRP